jgi:signal transduction histidine kinase
MKRLSLAVATVSTVLALVASGVAGWILVRDAKNAAAGEVVAVTRLPFPAGGQGTAGDALASLPSVESVRWHDPAGKLLSEYRRPARAYGLAARIAPPEVTCRPTGEGTVCVESSPAAIVPAVRTALLLVTAVPFAAAVLGFLAGRLIRSAVDRRLDATAETVEKATKENAWSLRTEVGPGAHGRLAAAINELLSQIQDREIVLRRRNLEIESANKDLESFAYSVSHDLRAPLGSIQGFTEALEMNYGDELDGEAHEYVNWIKEACRQMRELIEGLLQMSRLTKIEVEREPVDLSSIAQSIAESLQQSNPERPVRFDIREGVRTVGDERLLRAVLENLMANAWKFTRQRDEARIEFGSAGDAYFGRDNGAGFDPSHAAKMFRPFQRLHSSREFEGTGIGLATVQKIVERHGGRAWAEGEVGKGATIYFTTA